MDELSKGKSAFNWSDEEKYNEMDEESKEKSVFKQKYDGKKKETKKYTGLTSMLNTISAAAKLSPRLSPQKQQPAEQKPTNSYLPSSETEMSEVSNSGRYASEEANEMAENDAAFD